MKNLRMFFVDSEKSVDRSLDVMNGGAFLSQVSEKDKNSVAVCVMKLDIGAQRVAITLNLRPTVTGDLFEIPIDMRLESMDGLGRWKLRVCFMCGCISSPGKSLERREMELSAWYSGVGGKLEFKIDTNFGASPALANQVMVTHGPIDSGP
jgi:hypothetical protein